MASFPKAIEKIPEHLTPFISQQDHSKYTAIDHACWRFIMRVSKAFFSKTAHQKYLDGLRETGISTERIPSIQEMDVCLRKFGWRAVSVVGFIPPSVFMEFQSLGILPIACDMRTPEHLAYTPAPDIVHEAAGHAPIIADPEYATYLRNYGEVSRKAIYSKSDMAVYFAIRDLSDIKEDTSSSVIDIERAQKRLDQVVAQNMYVSEAAYLARMNWWTVEYGLVGNPKHSLIYGAGLLSSVGESFDCLGESIRKIPFTLDCINTSYDITRPQPQLFVTPDFSTLTNVLEEFAQTMAYRRGGCAGLAKAKMAEEVTTTVLESGIQISGVLADFYLDKSGSPFYLKYQGPVQLGYQDQELPDQGPKMHAEGLSTPLGNLKATGRSPADLQDQDFEKLGIKLHQKCSFEFESGVRVEGVLTSLTSREGKLLIMTFGSCTVRNGSEILFHPHWGRFDMPCGSTVISVFGGAADRAKYLKATGGTPRKISEQKLNLPRSKIKLNDFYAEIRKMRESKSDRSSTERRCKEIARVVQQEYPDDWLILLEIFELIPFPDLRSSLEARAQRDPETKTMIERGLALL